MQGKVVLEELAETIEEFGKSKKAFAEVALKAFASLAPLVMPVPELQSKGFIDLSIHPLLHSACRLADGFCPALT